MATAAQVDFTNVKEGGNFNKRHQPAGDYKARIMKVEDAVKKDDKSVKMWLWTIKVGSGTYPYYTTWTAENQLWKIRNLFVAAGKNVPKKRLKVNPDDIVGKDIGVTLEDEEYDDKLQSIIQATFPVSELEGSDGSGDDDDDDEDDDEESEDDDEEESDDEEEDEDEEEEEEEEEEPAPKAKKKKAAPAPEPAKKKKKAKPEVDDDELEELDIEEL